MSASSARLSFRNRLLFAAALAFALPALLVIGCGTGAYPFALDPKPILVLNAYRGDFGSIPINTSSQTFTITATNTGGAPLTINPITLSGSGASQFSEFNTCTQPIAPQATCAITLGFSPTLLGSATAQVVLTSNASNGPQTIALTGTGIPTPVPVVSLSVTSLDFGSVNLGSTSSAQSVTLTNTGNAPLLISSITLTGAGASSFQIALNGCPATLPATQSCILALDFKPVAVGPLSASLVFADNAAGAPHTVALTGTGVGVPALTITPTALTFAAAGISSTSAAQTVTLTNTGSANVTFTGLTLSGANATSFAQTNNCTTLAPNASCTASITFSPTALGPLSATLNIADNVTGSPQAVALSGTGAAPTLTITPTSLAFPSTNVGKTSATQTSTVKNTGTVSVAITSIVLSGVNATSFTETNNCPATLTSGASCTVTAAFAPTTAGALTASILLTDSATGSPQAIALSGTGAGTPLLTITPATLSFGTHDIGKLTTAKVVTVKNTGTAAATFSSIALAGTDPADFSISANTCGTSLAAASTCTVSVKFKALNAGKSTAKLDFTDNATGSPQTVTLNGTGNGPVITVTAALNFANTTVGKNSAKKSVTVSNTGNATATFNSFTLTGTNPGDFVIDSKTCGTTLAAAATCTVTLQFEPKAGGARTATLDVADDATAKPASPQTSTLTGTALQPIATLSPTSLTFAATNTGVATAAQVVTLTNTGTAAMTITSIAITGTDASSFTETKTCGATLAVNASCTVSVVFKPTTGGALTASLAFTDNAPGSPQTVALSGTGIGAPTITLTPTTVNFGANNVGVATAPKTITVKNTGTATATISAIALTAPTGFSQTNTCGATLAAGASCVVSAIFDAPTAGAFTTKLTVTDNATGSPQSATLNGTGNGPVITVTPANSAFGDVALGATSPAKTITIKNTGNANATISSIAIGGGSATQFAETNTCGATLAAAASCTASITFSPTKTGGHTAQFTVTDNATGSPQSVALNGTGTGPVIALSPATLTFTSTAVGTVTAAKTITVTNSGNATANITSLTLGGVNPTAFSQTNTCGATLAAAATCTVSVKFLAPATGTFTATVLVADNATGSPQSAALTGSVSNGSILKFSPSPFAFADTAVAASTTGTITLTNTGTAASHISLIDLTGANASSFSIAATTCGATLNQAASCTVSVKFTPTTTGPLTAMLRATDDATGSPQTDTLTGNGIAASTTVKITPASLVFPDTGVGVSSVGKSVTVLNTGTANLTVTSATIGGANASSFSVFANTCTGAIAPAASCTVTVKFTPAANGALAGTLLLADNATGTPQSVPLSGNGTGSPIMFFLPQSLNFGNVALNTTSPVKEFTITNNGTAAMNVVITIAGANAGAFAQTNTCPASILPNGQCTVNVTFSPTVAGSMSADVILTDNATGSPQSVPLSGIGGGPFLTFTPASLTFANTAVGVTTAAKTVTVTNTGTSSATLSSIGITGANVGSFAETTTCGANLAAAATCTLSVKFTPQADGPLAAAVTLTGNALNSPGSVPLSGTGTGAPAVTLTPTIVNFGSAAVGASAATQTITLTNSGSATLDITGFTLTGANPSSFSYTTTCGATLTLGSACNFVVKFSPSAPGALSATLSAIDNAANSPQTVSLNGTGTGTGSPALTLSPTSLNFGSLATGTSSALSVTATNTGTATLTLDSILLTGSTAYTRTTTCGTTLAVAASCSVTVTFAPVVTGSQPAALVFTDNAGTSPQTVGITGTATEGAVKLPTPTQPTLLYGSVVNGTAQPVSGATVKLYAFRVAGSAGQLLGTATTGVDGSFYFYKTGTPTFTCPSATTPVYLLATGGKPAGFTTANTDLEMMSVLGNCGALTTAVVNEATTVAGISAMANFISNDTTITWTANTLPVFNAQLAVALELVDPTTGVVPGTLPAGATADVAKVNSLANILYTCTHSAGGVAGDGSPCAALFAATTGIPDLAAPTPTETFTAMFNIAEYVAPWIKGVAALEQTSGEPFAPGWTTVPLDLMPIVMPLTQAPTFSPAAGTFTGSVAVTITSPTLGAQVYYTTDGSTPTTASTPYLTPITLTSGVTTLRAVAYENAMTVSAASTANYIVNGPHITLTTASPTIAVAPTTPVTTTLTLSAPSTTALTVTLTSGAPNALSLKPTTATATATITVPAGTTTTTFPVYGLNAGSVLLKATATGYGDGILRISPTLLTSATTVTSKSPIHGFTAVGYQGMNSTGGPDDNSLTQLTVDPGVWAGAVINIRWNEMEPTEGSYDFSAIELGLKNLAAANNTTGSNVAAKIRVFANSNVPSFLLSEEGGGIWMGPGGNGTGPENHDALFWSTHYETHFVALMNALAAEYDASSRVQEMVGSACANTTDEPYIMDITTISTGYNDGTTQYPSMHQQGENDAAMRECEEHQAQDYTAWKVTPLYTPFSTFRLSDLSTRFILATGFTLEQMRAFFEQRGALGIEGNQALEPESVIDTISSQLPVFDTFPVITSLGGNVGMQTNTQGALNQVCTNSGTGDDFVCWDPTVAYGVKQTGREIELWQTTNAPFPVAGGQGQAQYSLSDVQYWLNQYPQLH